MAQTTTHVAEKEALEYGVLSNRYELERCIGEGATALVYEAWDRALRRAVAVKILRPRLAHEPKLLDAFLHEAHTVAQLRHECIVEVLDVGRDRGTVFVVLELLRGETLAQRCHREGFLPWGRVRAIMRQVCSAVQAVHDARIVHRDIKPDNIICVGSRSELDSIKLVDFGISTLRNASDSDTDNPLGVSGTPAYMAPETYRGVFDVRSDIYAAGVLMYYLLTGHKPFDANSTSGIFEQHAHAQVPPPSSRTTQYLRPTIDFVVLKALSKDPGLRYENMREFWDAIESVGWSLLEGGGAHDEPSGSAHETRPEMPVLEVTTQITIADIDTRQ